MEKYFNNSGWQEYRTADLGLAAFLICAGFSKMGVEVNPNSQKHVFSFEKNDSLMEAIEDYWSKTARVEPQEYALAMKTIKSRIYETKF